ncbi:unnamed protein product [Gadus morhua 'NCC']
MLYSAHGLRVVPAQRGAGGPDRSGPVLTEVRLMRKPQEPAPAALRSCTCHRLHQPITSIRTDTGATRAYITPGPGMGRGYTYMPFAQQSSPSVASSLLAPCCSALLDGSNLTALQHRERLILSTLNLFISC